MIYILFTVLWVILCYQIAEKNNRDKPLALLMGLIFGLIAVIVYALIGEKR